MVTKPEHVSRKAGGAPIIRGPMSHRLPTFLTALCCALAPSLARAQAPPTAPVVLTQPSSARVAALGGAWVAGRDQDVVFTNPAQIIGVRSDFSLSLGRLTPDANAASIASTYAAGKMSFTLGWGLQAIDYAPPAGLLNSGGRQTVVAVVAGAVQYKGFKIGTAGKYATDRTFENRRALLMDVGVARNLFGGVAAVSMQNIGKRSRIESLPLPRQIAAGWSIAKPAGPLDLTLFTQVAHRSKWTSAAAGLEANYSWIEGYSVMLRAGVRRPDVAGERPIALGASVTGDRLTLDYAIRLYDNNRRDHLVTIRWR